MGKSDLQSAKQKWVQRIGNARSAGLQDSSWQGLMQRDLASVNQGHSPMQDREVIDAIRSSAGLSPIKDPSAGHGVLDVLGNIPGDIRDVVTGFPGGVVNYVTSLPEQANQLYWLARQDPQTIHDLGMEQGGFDVGGLLRNMSKVPVLSPILPGVHTAGALTTSEGRKELEAHPVSTLIDVAAAAAAAGKLGAFGKAADVAEGAAAPKTAMEALRQGQPYKAAGRAALTTVENTPKLGKRINRNTLRQTAMDLGIHPDEIGLARGRGQIENASNLTMQDWMKENITKPYKGLSEEDRSLVSKVAQETATQPEIDAVAARPELQKIVFDAKRLKSEMERVNPRITQVKTTWDRTYGYAKKSAVAKSYRKHEALDKKAKDRQAQVAELDREVKERALKFGANDKLTQSAQGRLDEAQAKFEKADKAAGAALKDFNDKLRTNAPPAFWAKLSEDVRTKAAEAAQTKFGQNAVQLDAALKQIESSVDFSQLRIALGDAALADGIVKDVESTWTELAKGGADPVWLPNVTGSKLNKVSRPSVIPNAKYAPGSASRETAFNLSRSVQDLSVGLSEAKRQLLTEAGTREFVDKHVKPFAKTTTQIQDDISRAISNGGLSGVDLRAAIQNEIDRHWVKWDPKSFGLTKHFPSPEGGEMMIPRGVQRSLKYLGFSDHSNPFFNTFDRGMKVWRFAVLSTPRHISHVLFGGLVMGELQDPFFLRDMRKAIGMVRGHDPQLERVLSRGIHGFNPDQLVMYSGARSLHRMLNAVTNGANWLKRFEENTTLMYKVSYMLKKERTGASRDEAMAMANKVFVDANAMSPLERGVFQKVFPFWSFTRHLFRYLMTYPVDHPYRAAILTNLANQHYADWQSGLPQQLQFMFFLGAPDSNGNVNAVDYRSIDPFRSFYNDFTLAGLTSQANPAIQFVAQQAGVNVLSATPELYPGTHYDPNSGTMVADRPKNFMLSALEAAVPEMQGADAMFQLSDQYRNLKTSDPEAFKHRVYTTLGIPFGPEEINVPAKVEAAQMKRYKDAQTSINQAVQTGDFSKAKRYASVPIPSLLQRYFGTLQYATPGQIEQIYRALQAQADRAGLSGSSLHALLPKG